MWFRTSYPRALTPSGLFKFVVGSDWWRWSFRAAETSSRDDNIRVVAVRRRECDLWEKGEHCHFVSMSTVHVGSPAHGVCVSASLLGLLLWIILSSGKLLHHLLQHSAKLCACYHLDVFFRSTSTKGGYGGRGAGIGKTTWSRRKKKPGHITNEWFKWNIYIRYYYIR